jgi:gluconate 5-dehydrogenase
VPAVRPLLLAVPAASVINVASMYGIVASRGPMPGYNATKGTLVNLTRQLAAQWGGRGVAGQRPGPWLLPDRADRPPGRRWLRPVHPRVRPARPHPGPERDRRPLLFLATAASSYMTGQILVIDGG